jgi:3-hydroxyacyl-[acyl-carrier-protein] dehydratase|tara:strand:+ start:1524 stop:1991 length:468 start_codon:yes stop_codon:yes gene_type:complete
MKKLSLDLNGIKDYQQNREPYLLIDFASEVIPGVSAKGHKDLKDNEWFFKVHWPNDPNMPGMLQIESLVQMCALAILSLPGNKGKVVYLTSANNLKFIKKIVPKTRLNIETKIKSYKRGLASCEGIGFVEKEIVCKADFNLILPEEIKKYSLEKN